MTLSGRLGELPIGEIVRLLVERERSGTLILRARNRRAELRFRRGVITSVRGPTSKPLGRLLVELGWLDEDGLELSLRVQERVRPRRSLAEVLVMTEMVDPARLRVLLTEQVEGTLAQLAGWTEGSFEFRPDDYGSMEITHAGDLVPALDLQAELLLLGEPVRRRSREHTATPDEEDAPRAPVAEPAPVREETGVDTRPVGRLAAVFGGDSGPYGKSVAPEVGDGEAGLERLRRVVSELRLGLHSGTVALGLMQMLAEAVERAVLLLVEGPDLVALGAFGFGQGGRPLAVLTRGMRLRPREGSPVAQALVTGAARLVPWSAADLPGGLAAALGRPSHEDVLLLPVFGSKGSIALVCADNGALERPIVGLDLLELAAAQIGVALQAEIE